MLKMLFLFCLSDEHVIFPELNSQILLFLCNCYPFGNTKRSQYTFLTNQTLKLALEMIPNSLCCILLISWAILWSIPFFFQWELLHESLLLNTFVDPDILEHLTAVPFETEIWHILILVTIHTIIMKMTTLGGYFFNTQHYSDFSCFSWNPSGVYFGNRFKKIF